MIVVSDTTPLSSLILLDRLFVLKTLFNKILIPEEVALELFTKPFLKSVIDTNTRWIEISSDKDYAIMDSLTNVLDIGESAAISLAIQRKANLILIDERKGKQVAMQYGLETTGTLGILVKAKQIGLLKEIKPDILKLKNELNFWISEALITNILQLAGE